ncbi:hypothetical protein E2C01_015260 [Portunus trituberculatus]|uniref:Uncharacterized protein n=1 Tax=Portunus trituberculatus TaxID=210409 RepID=A0A5B7DL69_PORTR|nr:hypothetical protein [Portunus trituberculatus]
MRRSTEGGAPAAPNTYIDSKRYISIIIPVIITITFTTTIATTISITNTTITSTATAAFNDSNNSNGGALMKEKPIMRSDMRGGSSAATVNLPLFFITRETAYQLPPRYAWECLHRRHYQTDCPGVLSCRPATSTHPSHHCNTFLLY